jgi:hypothetical protein
MSETMELQRLDSSPPAEHSGEPDILRFAVERGATIETIERLVKLKEREDEKRAKAAYAAAMQAAQGEMPQIFKDAKNPQTNSRYARLESVNKSIVPVYTKHGFSLSFGTADCPTPETIRVTCTIRHAAGHSEEHRCDVPLDVLGAKGNPSKTRTHGFGSSLSYGRRYLTLLIFNVSTGDDDDGNGAGKKQEGPDAALAMREELRGLLKHQGSKAQQWLWDEISMDPNKRVQDLSVAELREVIEKTKKRMAELKAMSERVMNGGQQ